MDFTRIHRAVRKENMSGGGICRRVNGLAGPSQARYDTRRPGGLPHYPPRRIASP